MEWCPDCGGSLEEYPDSFECSECGQSFTIDSDDEDYEYLDSDSDY